MRTRLRSWRALRSAARSGGSFGSITSVSSGAYANAALADFVDATRDVESMVPNTSSTTPLAGTFAEPCVALECFTVNMASMGSNDELAAGLAAGFVALAPALKKSSKSSTDDALDVGFGAGSGFGAGFGSGATIGVSLRSATLGAGFGAETGGGGGGSRALTGEDACFLDGDGGALGFADAPSACAFPETSAVNFSVVFTAALNNRVTPAFIDAPTSATFARACDAVWPKNSFMSASASLKLPDRACAAGAGVARTGVACGGDARDGGDGALASLTGGFGVGDDGERFGVAAAPMDTSPRISSNPSIKPASLACDINGACVRGRPSLEFAF